MKNQENYEELGLDGTHKILVYMDNVNLLGKDMRSIRH